MNNTTENKLNKPVMIIGVSVIMFLITATICILIYEKTEERNKEANIVNIEALADVSDIESIAVRDKVESLIRQGVNDCYKINGEYYTIISTGNSQFGIKYVQEGNEIVYEIDYDKVDFEFKPRYEIIKSDKPVKVVEKSIQKSWENGIVVVYIQDGIMHNLDDGSSKETNRPYSNGIYTFIYNEGSLQSSDKTDNYIIEAKVLKQTIGGTYELEIGGTGGSILTVDLDKLNIEVGSYIKVKLYYQDILKGYVI